RAEGAIGEGNFELLFRGAHASDLQRRQIEALGIEALVRFAEPVGYAQSLSEMLGADGLLLLQGSRFDNQVPGKSYEYIRAGKPIVAVTPADSATADSLSGVDGVFTGDEPSALAAGIREMLERSRPLERCVEVYSRRARTAELAARLDAAIDGAAAYDVGLADS
ncbi:MAG: hypothetical protein KDK91_19150, partial [Gammaproteobacteria bacterium]|nr:hypothetical protein [Gammaproteobacteria bacterium]